MTKINTTQATGIQWQTQTKRLNSETKRVNSSADTFVSSSKSSSTSNWNVLVDIISFPPKALWSGVKFVGKLIFGLLGGILNANRNSHSHHPKQFYFQPMYSRPQQYLYRYPFTPSSYGYKAFNNIASRYGIKPNTQYSDWNYSYYNFPSKESQLHLEQDSDYKSLLKELEISSPTSYSTSTNSEPQELSLDDKISSQEKSLFSSIDKGKKYSKEDNLDAQIREKEQSLFKNISNNKELARSELVNGDMSTVEASLLGKLKQISSG